MDAKQDKLTRMTTQPVKKLILRLAGPTIASMLISSLYNMADTFWAFTFSFNAGGKKGLMLACSSFRFCCRSQASMNWLRTVSGFSLRHM